MDKELYKPKTIYPQITQITQRAYKNQCYESEKLYILKAQISFPLGSNFAPNASSVFIRVPINAMKRE